MENQRNIYKGRYPELPVGGRLRFFTDQLKKITDEKWALSTISKGCKLRFQNITPDSALIQRTANAEAKKIINLEVEKLLEKGASLFHLWNEILVFIVQCF